MHVLDYHVLVGDKVFNIEGKVGTVTSYDGQCIEVDFGNKKSWFEVDALLKGKLSFVDKVKQNDVQSLIEKNNDENTALEKKVKECNEIARQRNIDNKAKAKKNSTQVPIYTLFDNAYHSEFFDPDQRMTYLEIEAKYGVNRGRSGILLSNDGILIFSAVKKDNGRLSYGDHWREDGRFVYTGQGNGDQSRRRTNQEIINSQTTHTPIHLFIEFSSTEYYYQGVYELENYTIVQEPNNNGEIRDVYKFVLKKA